jgi:uncharacterized membrane protein YecN with MAPEG domain
MTNPPGTFKEFTLVIIDILDLLVILIFALTFIFLSYKLLSAWVLHADNETKREEGKMYIITSVVVLFVMTSIWGIIRLLKNGFFG